MTSYENCQDAKSGNLTCVSTGPHRRTNLPFALILRSATNTRASRITITRMRDTDKKELPEFNHGVLFASHQTLPQLSK